MNNNSYTLNQNDTYLTKAQNDANAALILSQNPNSPIENILQLASQSIEKYFKYLYQIFSIDTPPRDHLNMDLYFNVKYLVNSYFTPSNNIIKKLHS